MDLPSLKTCQDSIWQLRGLMVNCLSINREYYYCYLDEQRYNFEYPSENWKQVLMMCGQCHWLNGRNVVELERILYSVKWVNTNWSTFENWFKVGYMYWLISASEMTLLISLSYQLCVRNGKITANMENWSWLCVDRTSCNEGIL